MNDVCKIGDGVGGSEKKLPDLYTLQQCIDAVRLQYPDANGATMNLPCDGSENGFDDVCECYAEFGMTGWNSDQSWQSCKLVS